MQNSSADESSDLQNSSEIRAVEWIDKNDLTRSNNWRIVNDDVMGGVSNSQVEVNPQSVFFNGALSMENNGGFASVVFLGLQPMSEADKGFSIRVKGDGRTYQLRFNMQGEYSAVSYSVSFTTNGEIQQLYFPFSDFEAVYRGRDVYGAPELDPEKINRLRLLIADKQTQPFAIQILGFGPVSGR